MRNEASKNQSKENNFQLDFGILFPIFAAVAALIITFSVSVSSLEFITKTGVFITITVVYLVCVVGFFLLRSRPIENLSAESENNFEKSSSENVFSQEVEEKLLALEEANTIFGASLKPSDMFRLVSNRINEIIPFTTAVMFLVDEESGKLKAIYTFGMDSLSLSGIEIQKSRGLVGETFQQKIAQFDNELKIEKRIVPVEIVQNLKSGIACPLLKDGESYGVLVLYSDFVEIYDEKSLILMNAIGSRISPLFINSITFERSLNNAMIDSLTKLPNERALFFVLENQIAESQRLREQRPLTVLGIDIQGFNGLNKNYGHILGDRILSFVADNIKVQLRQMDFLSRINGDDFLAVLPTSSQETTEIIVERIEKNFETKPFIFDDGGKIYIKLHFGLAVFLTDGETADDLLKIARLKKQEAKSPVKNTVLWFPQELIN